jgi:hypothetical protein
MKICPQTNRLCENTGCSAQIEYLCQRYIVVKASDSTAAINEVEYMELVKDEELRAHFYCSEYAWFIMKIQEKFHIIRKS